MTATSRPRFRPAARVLAPLLAAALLAADATPAAAFWFFNAGKDAVDAAFVAGEAKKRYYQLLVDPDATPNEIAAAKAAWDILRKATFARIKEYMQSVPGTSLTGPSDVKDLTEQLIQEIIKEALGDTASLHSEGLPTVALAAGDLDQTTGPFEGTPIFDSIPVDLVAAEDVGLVELSYLLSTDYDGSLGPAPDGFYDIAPMLFISGTFEGVGFDAFDVFAAGPGGDAFGGVGFDAAALADALAADPELAGLPLGGGLLDSGLAAFVDGALAGAPGIDAFTAGGAQFGYVEITAVDVAAGTVSGAFVSVNVSAEVPAPAALGLLGLGLLGLGGLRLRRGRG